MTEINDVVYPPLEVEEPDLCNADVQNNPVPPLVDVPRVDHNITFAPDSLEELDQQQAVSRRSRRIKAPRRILDDQYLYY